MNATTMTNPSLSHVIIRESKATESAIDDYATRVLRIMSPSETSIFDESLGPYVTSLLRCADIKDKDQVTRLAEFDCILELLEDQCNMDKKLASDCVKLIADAVVTRILPISGTSLAESNDPLKFGLFIGGGGLDSFDSMKSHLATIEEGGKTGSCMPGPSAIKPDNLIPIDLMGVLDNPSPNYSDELPNNLSSFKEFRESQFPSHNSMQKQSPLLQQYPQHRISHEDDFPSLSKSKEKPKKSKIGGKKLNHSKSQQHSDKDLAATLFRPARPRQNSIESEDAASSHQQRSRGSSNASTTMTNSLDDSGSNNNIFFEQQLDSCVEILLSMNQDLSEEAASEASLMANTDFNLAQHIIDSALAAPPICRHMLHEGCYRSDCTFSHDVDGHTCLFWLRGRCGKGTACKFLHGFNEKLLNAISCHESIQSNVASCGYILSQYPSPTGPPSSWAPISTGGFEAFPSVLSSSWDSPSLQGVSRAGVPQRPTDSSGSFANIASRGYENNKFFEASTPASSNKPTGGNATVRIPQDLWNPSENRDASVFYIADPLERYEQVNASVRRSDVIDLHFQSTKTFHLVLSVTLPLKLSAMNKVWIITGTGHHVGKRTHQKGGGTLEQAVIQWLMDENYNFSRGKDSNGLSGALLVNR